MRKKLVSLAAAVSLMVSALPLAMPVSAESSSSASSARQMEYLDRGTVAVKVTKGVYLSWRLLGTENYNTSFDVYRDNTYVATVSDSTNYTDSQGSTSNKYTVVVSGQSVSTGKSVEVWSNNCLSIPLTPPTYSCTFEDTDYTFTYSANDASCADLDGDGEYEIILKWDPSGSFDSGTSHTGPSGNVFIDAYKLDGTRLWRMDLGENISAGAHFTQIAAYDFDLDGKGEVAFKTAPGSKDGQGNYVSAASLIDAIKNTENNETDYRQSDGRVMSGDEYYTVFDGETGAALDTVYYPHARDCHDSLWGDTGARWNRSERYLSTVAYLDGETPSMIAWRGYYDKTTVTAYNLVNKRLVQAADFDTDVYTGANSDKTITGQGNHNTAVADVDNDGKDEILSGGLCLELANGDFSVKWTLETGHGDALHLADYDPTHDGMEYFIVHEHEPYGMSVVYPEDGTVIYHQDSTSDTGRGIMVNSKADSGYYQIWGVGTDYCEGGTTFGHYDASGSLSTKSANFRIFWDGDVYDEMWANTGNSYNQIAIDKGTGRLTTIDTYLNNSTKANVCLQADLLGDWREELVGRNSDSTELQIYTTTYSTTEKLYTLMQDSAYRMQVAGQNSAYNQPPHIGYYISADNDANDKRKYADYITTVHDGVTAVRTANVPTTPIEVTPTTDTITATKVRNEIGTGSTTPATGTVWLNCYDKTWGTAYFGFSDITGFNPDLLTSATLEFTAISYATTNRNRQFYFDLFGTDNSWEAGTVQVSSNPYPSSATKISSTSCYTQYGKGDVLQPETAASFDVTDYVKTLAKGTTDMSFIAAIPSGSGGAGACELTMYNNPTLVLTYKAPDLTGITVTAPQKTTYVEGEELDLTGMVVNAVYSDDSTVELEDGNYSVDGYESTVGTHTVTVQYGNYTDTFTVTVNAKELTGITVTAPQKTTYIEGEELDLTGMAVTAAYNNGTSASISSADAVISGYNKNQVGTQTVTVTYNGKSDTFNVTVNAKTLNSISITSNPTKVSYYVGEELDISGLAVKAVYDNNTEETVNITAENVTGYDKNTVGEQTLTVTYNGKSAEFKINVVERPSTDPYIDKISDTTTLDGGRLTGTVKAKIVNQSDSAKLIFAVYDENGLLINLQVKDFSGEDIQFDNLDIESVGASYSFKIFAWNSLSAMSPICTYLEK